ncbi:hypothetical protein LAZ29_20490 [Cereibacter sphaeroides]|uniref:hypothetical protein n=1 Tax=Cereibacter sphaeroides TaxID=1063 RepID=UPI001F257F22|nr:hypothetical protein [Cereibacter sphaeroides]MCE6953311.1 hypothetical protein [Cereibacter sphaeroides]
MHHIRAILIGAAVLAAPGAWAGQLAEVIFRPGAFAATEGVTRYAHERAGPDTEGFRRVAAGELIVTPGKGERGPLLTLTHRVDGQDQPVADFPASGGDPVLLWFLENTVRSMALLTEGSPFYIRNRMREALGSAGLDEAEGPVTAELRPFATDPKRAEMGPFADMVLRITVDPSRDVPLRQLSADTTGAGGSYRETLTLEAP